MLMQPAFITDPNVWDTIIELLREGMPREFAAKAAGINGKQIFVWIRKAEKGEEPYLAFYLEMEKARSEAVRELLKDVRKGGKGSGGAQFILDRKYGYQKTEKREHTGHVEISAVAKKSDEDLEAERIALDAEIAELEAAPAGDLVLLERGGG